MRFAWVVAIAILTTPNLVASQAATAQPLSPVNHLVFRIREVGPATPGAIYSVVVGCDNLDATGPPEILNETVTLSGGTNPEPVTVDVPTHLADSGFVFCSAGVSEVTPQPTSEILGPLVTYAGCAITNAGVSDPPDGPAADCAGSRTYFTFNLPFSISGVVADATIEAQYVARSADAPASVTTPIEIAPAFTG